MQSGFSKDKSSSGFRKYLFNGKIPTYYFINQNYFQALRTRAKL
jgi:hypothetical protein